MQIIKHANRRILQSLFMKRVEMKSDQKNMGIVFDQENIKKKMQQIKDRRSSQAAKDKQDKKIEFMSDYNIPKKLKPTVQKFRQQTQSTNLFQIQDVSLDEKPTDLQVTAFSEEYIQIDNFNYPPSVIITPRQVFNWEILSMDEVKLEHFKIIEMVDPFPTYIVIGCKNPGKFPIEIQKYLSEKHGNYDIVEMFQAISNFNTVVNDDIQAMAFLNPN